MATSATVTEHETMFCLDIHNLRTEMMWNIQKKLSSLQRTHNKSQFSTNLLRMKDLTKTVSSQSNGTSLSWLFLSFHLDPNKPTGQPNRAAHPGANAQGHQEEDVLSQSSRSQRCIYKNPIKPLTLKLFHHTFWQLKV